MEHKKENSAGQGGAYKGSIHKQNTVGQNSRRQGNFHRDRLPEPDAVLNLLGIKTEKKNAAGYWVLCCPFHAGGQEKNPSMNLHTRTGHYLCHACGAKGGDILAFYMAVTGLKFPDAAKKLGAWGEAK